LKRLSLFKDDRGAISFIFIILLGTGFLLTLFALVVDSGQVYFQRTKVQTAADAVAQALAKNCTAKTLACTSTLDSTGVLQNIANSESPNYPNYITEICGSPKAVTDSSSRLAACATLSTTNPRECKAVNTTANPQYLKYVRVHVSTVSKTGQNSALYPFLSSVINGKGPSSINLTACAQYAYGKATAVTTSSILKIVLGDCVAAGTSPIAVMTPDTRSACNAGYDDKEGAHFSVSSSTLLGWSRLTMGTVACPTPTTIQIGDKLCLLPTWTDTAQTADFWGKILSPAARPATAALSASGGYSLVNKAFNVPVINAVASGKATVASFVTIRLQAIKFPPTSGTASTVIYIPSNTAPGGSAAKNWASFCPDTDKYCFYAGVEKSVSTLAGSSSNVTAPNFGLESLTPLP